jgi:hypothetical protein
MGVSSRWKTPADWGQAPANACTNETAEGLGSRRLDTQFARGDRDQALALLSTARSERSA